MMARRKSDNVLVVILAGGEGSRLYPLTLHRAKPAVPFGGRYRIVDFVLSNFINSGFYRIKVLTQYKSDSLSRHISRGFRLNSMLGFFVETIPAQMRLGPEWYRGSADAIYQNIESIIAENPSHVCVFGADHIYKMDVSQMLENHIVANADCTVAAIPFPTEEAGEFGIISINDQWKMIDFVEKPENPTPIPSNPSKSLVSMGNYIFKTDVLIDAVSQDAKDPNSSHDFGKNILPNIFPDKNVKVYDFNSNIVPGMHERERGYWRDVGGIESYWQSSMDLASVSPVIDIHNKEWPLLTNTYPAPPAKLVWSDQKTKRIGIATDSLICEGCIISGGHIHRTILSPNVRINSFSNVEESILFDNVDVGRHAMIRRAIVDKNVNIPPYTQIGYDLDEDRKRYHVTDTGIVVIAKGMEIR